MHFFLAFSLSNITKFSTKLFLFNALLPVPLRLIFSFFQTKHQSLENTKAPKQTAKPRQTPSSLCRSETPAERSCCTSQQALGTAATEGRAPTNRGHHAQPTLQLLQTPRTRRGTATARCARPKPKQLLQTLKSVFNQSLQNYAFCRNAKFPNINV